MTHELIRVVCVAQNRSCEKQCSQRNERYDSRHDRNLREAGKPADQHRETFSHEQQQERNRRLQIACIRTWVLHPGRMRQRHRDSAANHDGADIGDKGSFTPPPRTHAGH